MRADETTETAVTAVLDKLAEVYVTRDLAVMRAIFAPDPDVVMYSPGTEARVGLSEIVAKAESDWSKSDAASLTYGWTSAWVATDADFTVKVGEQERTIPARITFVLEKRGEQWLIVQAHYSFTATPSGG